jgi:hypothetical protein
MNNTTFSTAPIYRFKVKIFFSNASSAFNNPTFCPHSVFICFVWISEQTAIISLLLFLQSFDCLAAFHLDCLQAILFIAVEFSSCFSGDLV